MLTSLSDLSIRVRDRNDSECCSKKNFHVSRAVMCLASPVWKAMLAPDRSFKEARPESSHGAVVDFSDDDPEALHLLLNIAHLNFHELPESLKYEELLQVCVPCDKYDMIWLLRPWTAR